MSEDFPALTGFRAGSLLAGYQLEAQVGAGGMAVVFRARDQRLDRLVALKILTPMLTADASVRDRFLAESRAAAAVDDPHIIPVYEAGAAAGVLFIAMRFVAGGDLRLVLDREGPLAPGRAAGFLSPVASALDAAHRAGLVHRDVKPANILVDARPDRPDHVYLSDFGVSKAAAASLGLTVPGQYMGTPDYSAPEQIQGQAVDGRTDQYALACVACQLLTGTTPFERDDAMAVLYAHRYEPPPSLSARRPGLPEAADRVLARGLAKVPEQRYASCRDFADALREALGLAPYPRSPTAAPDHPDAQIDAPPPEFPGPTAPGAGKPAVPTGPAAAASPMTETVPAPANSAADRTGAEPDAGPAVLSGHGGRQTTPAPRDGRPRVAAGGEVQRTWRPRRLHVITLVGAVLAVAAIVAFVLASSPGSPGFPPTLAYSQFLADVAAHRVKTVDLAPSAGGTSSGTLTDGTSYTVVIPPQAGQSLLTDLESNGVVIEGASSSGSPGTLAYSQFLADVAAHRVKTVDLAPSAGGTSSGTLTDGITYTVVIPPQAGRSLLLTFLHDNGVQITGASSSFTASFSMTRHIISCVGGCITGPLPLTIACHSDGSCTVTSSHWNSSKQGTINGNTLSFSGIDTKVSGCYQPSQITLNLTVTSWSAGNAATRQPLALSGPYTVVAPATPGCSAWDLNATLTSS